MLHHSATHRFGACSALRVEGSACGGTGGDSPPRYTVHSMSSSTKQSEQSIFHRRPVISMFRFFAPVVKYIGLSLTTRHHYTKSKVTPWCWRSTHGQLQDRTSDMLSPATGRSPCPLLLIYLLLRLVLHCIPCPPFYTFILHPASAAACQL